MTASANTMVIVEDDIWMGEQFCRVLRKSGYVVHITTNGLAAMDVIDQVKPTVIVVDMLLSGGTVMPLLHELQSYTDTGPIPIILCTSMAADIRLQDLKPYGVQRIVDKTTMLPDDIAAAVKGVLL